MVKSNQKDRDASQFLLVFGTVSRRKVVPEIAQKIIISSKALGPSFAELGDLLQFPVR